MGSVIENEKIKKCQIFTPDDIVDGMLNHLGYSDHLYGKTVLESSCGNGQFLKEIVIRYIKDCESRGLSRGGRDLSRLCAGRIERESPLPGRWDAVYPLRKGGAAAVQNALSVTSGEGI